MNKPIKLGVIEFHTPQNKALIDDFYHTVTDLRDTSCIVDLWLLDISRILEKHGYMMSIYKRDDAAPENNAQTGAPKPRYKTGDKAICQMCHKPIVFVGPYWDHEGELKPRHPALPE